jgi:hypothetical protein
MGRMSNPITAAVQTAFALITILAKGTATLTPDKPDIIALNLAALQFIPNPVTNSQALILVTVTVKNSNLSNGDE